MKKIFFMICILILLIIGIFGMFGCKAEFHPISTIKLEPVAKNVIAQRICNRQYLYLFEIGDHEYIGMENTKLIHKIDCKCQLIKDK